MSTWIPLSVTLVFAFAFLGLGCYTYGYSKGMNSVEKEIERKDSE